MFRIKWMWRVLVSKIVIVIDDRGMVVHMPLTDPNTFEDIVLLSAQQASMAESIRRLELARKEHKSELDLLIRRGKQSNTATKRKQRGNSK